MLQNVQRLENMKPSEILVGVAVLASGLLDRIYERKRAALVDLNGAADAPPRRRLRRGDPQENTEEKVSVQRFTLVSRGAPPAKRKQPAQHEFLRVPPRDSVNLGDEIHVCHCSDCDKHGVRRRLSGRRTCRRDTESHPEYALLLNLTDRFEEECERENARDAVNEACCREKSAFFILGPGSTAVGYVAAEVAANRRVQGVQDSDDDKTPFVTQIYVEPEFRQQGYASQALSLLLRDHGEVRVDAATLAFGWHADRAVQLRRKHRNFMKSWTSLRPLVTSSHISWRAKASFAQAARRHSFSMHIHFLLWGDVVWLATVTSQTCSHMFSLSASCQGTDGRPVVAFAREGINVWWRCEALPRRVVGNDDVSSGSFMCLINGQMYLVASKLASRKTKAQDCRLLCSLPCVL